MKTSMDIPTDLLKSVKEQSGVTTNRKAVILALSEYLRRQQLENAANFLGTFTDLPDTAEIIRQRKKR